MTTVKLERSDDLLLTLPKGWGKAGEKVSLEVKGDTLVISKMKKITVDFDEKTFLKLAIMAHERDITLNEMVTLILREEFFDEKY